MPEATILVIFFTSLVVGYSGSLMPGPLLTLNITESAKRGFWAGPLLVSGHAVAELAIAMALAVGLARLIGETIIGAIVGLLGGLFLLWMGYSIIRSVLSKSVTLSMSKESGSASMHPVLAGIFVSVANPFWVLWWATIGSAYVLWSLQLGAAGLLSFWSGHILSDLTWYSFVAFVIATGRRFIKDSIYRGLLLVCGIFLVGLAVYFVFFGIRALLSPGIIS